MHADINAIQSILSKFAIAMREVGDRFQNMYFAAEKEYMAVIKNCNDCHAGMAYGFVKVVKQKTSADMGIDYKVKSKPTDVPT